MQKLDKKVIPSKEFTILPDPTVDGVEKSLKSVAINATIYDAYAVTMITQEYVNASKEALEVSVAVPLGDDTVVKSFKAKMGDNVAVSKIFPTEKAKEKYTDAVSQGNTAVIGTVKENSPDELEVKIGYLPAQEVLILEIEVINKITSEDCSRKYHLTLNKLPEIIVQKKRIIVNPCYCWMCCSRLGGGKIERKVGDISSSAIKDFTYKIPVTFSAVYISPSKITRFTSPSHEFQANFSEDLKIVNTDISYEDLIKAESHDLTLLYKNEDLNMPRLYSQYDQKLKQYSYMLNYQLDQRTNYDKATTPDTNRELSYEDKYESKCINDTPSTFIFLLDQSGSMKIDPMSTAKEALIMFIRSLPAGSEFRIIGFGTQFIDYFGILEYTKENIERAIQKIKTLSSNFNGTNIYDPLDDAFDSGNSYNPKLAKNVFLLTDGQVANASSCLKLIKDNQRAFRVHALGIGSGVSKEFITDCGKVGRGSYHFAPELKDIKRQVIKALNKALKFHYRKVEINFNPQVKIQSQYPNSRSFDILYQDEVLSYAFITDTPLDPDTVLTFSGRAVGDAMKDIDAKIPVKDLLFDLGEGTALSKYIVGFKCRDDPTLAEEMSVKLGCLYQILTKGTSLFVEIENQGKELTEMKVERIPAIFVSAKVKETIYVVNRHSLINSNMKLGLKPNNRSLFYTSSTSSSNAVNLIDGKPLKLCSNNLSSASNNSNYKIETKSSSGLNKINPSYRSIRTASRPLSGKSISSNSSKSIMMPEKLVKKDKMNDMCITGSTAKKSNKKSKTKSSEEKEEEFVKSVKLSEKSVSSLYDTILSLQEMEGNWSFADLNSQSTFKKIIETHKELVEKIKLVTEEMLNSKSNSDSQMPGDNVILTVFILYYLYTKYATLQEEFFFIANKAKKYLLKKGIDYDVTFNLISA